MSKRQLSTTEELDALPEGSVVLGYDVDELRPIVAMKPLAIDYPSAVDGYWQSMNSELGTTASDLIEYCTGPLELIHEPTHD